MAYIHKHALADGDGHLTVPRDAEILHAAMQRGVMTLWYLTSGEQQDTRVIAIAGTGASVPFTKSQYIGTVMDDPYVWHLFEWVTP